MFKLLSYRKIIIGSFAIVALLACTFFLSPFFLYGSADSLMINFVGRNLNHFVEYEKTGTVSIANKELTIVYYKKTYDIDESYLIIKKLPEESEEIIFQGNLGHDIKNVFIDENNERLLYTFQDIRKDFDRIYLIVYDLETMRETNKIMMMDQTNYKNEEMFLGGGAITFGELFDASKDKIYFRIHFKANTVNYYGIEYFFLDINTEEIEEISESQYAEISNNPSIFKNSNTYIDLNSVKRLFHIYSYSNYLPANYKPKYNGTYINDGLHNIRISKSANINDVASDVFWLYDGQYVICGSYIYDTSGKMREAKVVDGTVLAVY